VDGRLLEGFLVCVLWWTQSLAGLSGCPKQCFVGMFGSQQKLPPQLGHSTMGQCPGPSGGKASTMISSTQSVWLQERQWYLYHSLGSVHGPSIGSCLFCEWFVIQHLREEPELLEDTVLGMIDQFQLHGVAALWAGQRVFPKGFLEPLCKR